MEKGILKNMHVYNGVQQIPRALSASVVTIGNFDGVHLGHRHLLESLIREARHYGVPSVVFTFFPHPVEVLYPERPSRRLFGFRDQQEQFEILGIDHVILEKFTLAFSKMSPQEFFDDYILKPLNPKTLVVGHDFSFGVGRAGNLNFLEQVCFAQGIRLIIIPPFQVEHSIVSSTQIRNELEAGHVEKANQLLGRTYYLRGFVEKGFQRGRSIGTPTANIKSDASFVPRLGVYCTETFIGSHKYLSITNIGRNPTFQNLNEQELQIATHLLDFDDQLYGMEIQVHLRHFLRDEKKFSGVEQLKSQIQKDIESARRYFNEQN